MSDSKSITYWFQQFKSGDKAALGKVWELYFDRLVVEARGKLKGYKPQAAGSVDIVQSVFRTFLRCGQEGRLPEFDDPEHLWCYLAKITLNKVHDLQKHELAKKRGGGKVIRESNLQPDPDQSAHGIDGLAYKNYLPQKPIPATPGGAAVTLNAQAFDERIAMEGLKRDDDEPLDAQVGHVLTEWIELLDHEQYKDLQLRQIIEWTIQGETVDEIAKRLDCQSGTVEKKLRLIRKIWKGGPS